ncbi:MAG TPA: hypothetical protein VFT78_14330, partial [Hanamia sp.]|nr:hypothetical protein [Hanamia sp.]
MPAKLVGDADAINEIKQNDKKKKQNKAMKKICLTVVGLYFWVLSAFSQQYNVDTSSYQNQKLKLDEVNLVSGYFNQDGNHSAVTGGIGTQKLNDVSNVIELKFVKQNELNNKYTWDFEVGYDHHTAAS